MRANDSRWGTRLQLTRSYLRVLFRPASLRRPGDDYKLLSEWLAAGMQRSHVLAPVEAKALSAIGGRMAVRDHMIPRLDLEMAEPGTLSDAGQLVNSRQDGFLPIVKPGPSREMVGITDMTVDPPARLRHVFVPEYVDPLTALCAMAQARAPVAIVIDEFGSTTGMVTARTLANHFLDAEPTS